MQIHEEDDFDGFLFGDADHDLCFGPVADDDFLDDVDDVLEVAFAVGSFLAGREEVAVEDLGFLDDALPDLGLLGNLVDVIGEVEGVDVVLLVVEGVLVLHAVDVLHGPELVRGDLGLLQRVVLALLLAELLGEVVVGGRVVELREVASAHQLDHRLLLVDRAQRGRPGVARLLLLLLDLLPLLLQDGLV